MSKSQQRVSQISIVSICELKVMVSLIGRSSNRMLKFFQFKSEAEKKYLKIIQKIYRYQIITDNIATCGHIRKSAHDFR